MLFPRLSCFNEQFGRGFFYLYGEIEAEVGGKVKNRKKYSSAFLKEVLIKEVKMKEKFDESDSFFKQIKDRFNAISLQKKEQTN